MNTEIFNTIKEISLEALIISLGVFLLTELLKWPIKKITAKLTEEKRKAVNSLIIFIPIILSLISSTVYFGVTKSNWFSMKMLEMSFSAWVLSVSFYAIYSRVVIIIKGVLSGKISLENNLTKETITTLKNEIKQIASKIKIDEKTLSTIQNKVDGVVKTKKTLEEKKQNLNIAKISQTNIELKALEEEKNKLVELVQKARCKKENCLQKLKGEK